MSFDNLSFKGGRRDKMAEPAQLLASANLWTPTADQKAMIGAKFETNQGNEYVYCKNGSTALVKNVMVQTPAQDAQQFDTIQTTADTIAVGTKVFNIITTTGNDLSDGDLVDGYMVVNQGSSALDEGDMYIITANSFVTSDTLIQIEIADAGGLRNAISATSNVTFIKNIYRDVIVQPTTVTGPVVGANQTIVPASYYFWAQTKGVASVIIDASDTVIVGDPLGTLSTGNGTDGSVGLVATFATDAVFGTCVYAAAGADYGLINLSLT